MWARKKSSILLSSSGDKVHVHVHHKATSSLLSVSWDSKHIPRKCTNILLLLVSVSDHGCVCTLVNIISLCNAVLLTSRIISGDTIPPIRAAILTTPSPRFLCQHIVQRKSLDIYQCKNSCKIALLNTCTSHMYTA